jgi:hypothetical protein
MKLRLSTRRAVFAVAVFLCVAATAAPASARHIWTISAMERAFPTSVAGPFAAISLSAAGNEWEGAQIVLKPTVARRTVFTWADGSDPLLVDNSTLQRVGYVRITHHTFNVRTPLGLYPDPLLPAGFNKTITVPAQTTSFYVLFHVPYGTAEGDYKGTINVSEGGVVTPVPVTVHVWAFGWQKLSMSTSFQLSPTNVGDSLKGVLTWSNNMQNKVMANYYKFFADYGLNPGRLAQVPVVNKSTGNATWSPFVTSAAPFLDASNATRVPFFNWVPWLNSDVPNHRAAALTYLTELARVYKENGWDKKAFVYDLDEPLTVAQGKAVERMAALVHQASAAAGYRMRFLITDDPRSHQYLALPANSYLFNDIDIWCVRYFYYFGRLTEVRARQKAGADVWWYFYANRASSRIPTWVIDKGLTDERVIGWQAYQFNVNGLLYYQANRWGLATTNAGYRNPDPYHDPVTIHSGANYANGEAMFIYPGYEPSVGLNDPYGPPRSSLRLEAIRDGLEENEYLRLAAMTGGADRQLTVKSSGADAFAKAVIKSVTTFVIDPKLNWNNQFPTYTTSQSAFNKARQHLGNRISRYVDGLPQVIATGTVVDAVSGAPIVGATVSDSTLKTTTSTTGSYSLANTLPFVTLTVSAPKHRTVYVKVSEGDAPLTVALPRL